MRLLGSIVLILLGAVDRLGHQLTRACPASLGMSNAVAAQLIGNDLPGLAAMGSQ